MTDVFLTPSVATLLDRINANPAPTDDSPAAQRVGLDAAMAQLGWPPPEGAPAADAFALPSGARVHLFRRAGDDGAAAPLLVYVHGGSFFAGGAKSHGPLAQALAAATGATVALIEYRLAPEHKAPAALDDCVAAVRELVARATEFRIDPARLGLLGDSAGGALAAGAALVLRGELSAGILVLVNPMTSPSAADDASLRDFATGYFAGTQDFAAGWAAYGGSGDNGAYHDLLKVDDLSGLPPTIVVSNEADPVRDQGERFADRLATAGVTVLSLRARGLIHAAWLFPKPLPEAHLLFALIAGAVRIGMKA